MKNAKNVAVLALALSLAVAGAAQAEGGQAKGQKAK